MIYTIFKTKIQLPVLKKRKVKKTDNSPKADMDDNSKNRKTPVFINKKRLVNIIVV